VTGDNTPQLTVTVAAGWRKKQIVENADDAGDHR
jgi:hypothetical protein